METSIRSRRAFDSRGFTRNIAKQTERVNMIKQKAAELWDIIDNTEVSPGNSEAGRLVNMAKSELEITIMIAVKAVSRE